MGLQWCAAMSVQFWGGCCWARAAGPAETTVTLPSPLHCPQVKPQDCPHHHPEWGGTPAGSDPGKGTPCSRGVVIAQGPPQSPKIPVVLVAQLSKQSTGRDCFAPAHSPPCALVLVQAGTALLQPWQLVETNRVCICATAFPTQLVQKTLSLWMVVKIRPKKSSALMSSATVSLCGFFRAAARSVQCCLIA